MRTNQVRTSDICSIPMAKGFMFLTVIMDWHSPRIQAWQISNTLETNACVEALEVALLRYGPPEIFNTDHGAQFTSEVFPAMLKAYEVKIRMEGSRWVDNVMYNTERRHQALNRRTPDAVYFADPESKEAA